MIIKYPKEDLVITVQDPVVISDKDAAPRLEGKPDPVSDALRDELIKEGFKYYGATTVEEIQQLRKKL